MKSKIVILGFVLLGMFGVAPVHAEDAAPDKLPELRGMLADESGRRFGLLIPGSEQTAWVTVGQTLGGWKLKEYRAADETLVLSKDGRDEVLHLAESTIGEYHPATATDAEALLKVMKLDQRMAEMFKRGMERMAKQLLMRNGIANPTPEQVAAVQKLIGDQLQVAAGQFQASMAGVMGAIYTQEDLKAQTDFYGTSSGQTALDKMFGVDGKPGQREPDELKAFYATDAGHLVQLKQPQLQAKIGAALQPVFGPMMASVQKTIADYAKQQGAVTAPAVKATP
ncbi:MAG TPA: hypothetical protein VL357_03695 [Rariglobus sp.]|jgi:hypothetical protein|nr:hypothetical protein [Rariglobus sp.]